MNKADPMRDVLKRASGLGLILPLSPCNASKDYCSYYQIKGLCNCRCGRSGHYVPYPPGGYQTLMELTIKVTLGEERRGGGGGGE